MLYLISFIIVISILVFVHEFGHYYAAIKSGVKVSDFSIGFGKEIFGFVDKRGTRWKVSMIPLGGYVKMHGDKDPASASVDANIDEKDPHAFFNKPLWIKSIIVLAGPLSNYLFAIIILTCFYMALGVVKIPNIIGKVENEGPAYSAGLKEGDLITNANGMDIESFAELKQIISLYPDKEITISIVRDGQKLDIPVKVGKKTIEDKRGDKIDLGYLGVGSVASNELTKLGPIDASMKAVKDAYNISVLTLKALGQILTGSRSTDQLGGPLTIAMHSSDSLERGLLDFIWFMAMLSINLGLINLLPIPILDGGHMLGYVIESIAGKKTATKFMSYANYAGAFIIALLMLVSVSNDLKKVFFR